MPPSASASEPAPAQPASDDATTDESAPSDTVLLAGITLLAVGAVAGGLGAALVVLGNQEDDATSGHTGIGLIIGGGTTFVAGIPVTIAGGVLLSDDPEPAAPTRPSSEQLSGRPLQNRTIAKPTPGITLQVPF